MQVVSNLVPQLLSQRLAVCLLLVDYTNPVYSATRLDLMQYVFTGASGAALLIPPCTHGDTIHCLQSGSLICTQAGTCHRHRC